MITIITGLPGLGKTALAVAMMREWQKGPRYVMGIPDLTVEHEKVPAVKDWTELRSDPDDPELKLPYYTFPAGSLIVLDEAQRVFRPRSVGAKVPDHVAAYETHRHTGVDFILLTQHPGLIDGNIRKLCNRHIHLHDTFMGTFKLEWPQVQDPESKSDRDIAARSKFKPPKASFGLYKSSEQHLKRPKAIPKYVYLLAVCVCLLVGAGWYLYGRMHAQLAPALSAGSAAPGGAVAVGSQPPVKSGPKSVGQWIAEQQPRVQGLAYSAPIYDDVTKATEAPYPAACVRSENNGCRCYSQQGTRLDVPLELCGQIIERGFFVAWKPLQKAGPGDGRYDGREAAGVPAVPMAWRPVEGDRAPETRQGGAIRFDEPASVKDRKG